MRRKIDDAESHIASLQKEQEHNDEKITSLQKKIAFGDGLTAKDRLELLADLANLNDRNKELEAEHGSLDQEIRQLRRELGRLGVDTY